jgi:hypothetical protein
LLLVLQIFVFAKFILSFLCPCAFLTFYCLGVRIPDELWPAFSSHLAGLVNLQTLSAAAATGQMQGGNAFSGPPIPVQPLLASSLQPLSASAAAGAAKTETAEAREADPDTGETAAAATTTTGETSGWTDTSSSAVPEAADRLDGDRLDGDLAAAAAAERPHEGIGKEAVAAAAADVARAAAATAALGRVEGSNAAATAASVAAATLPISQQPVGYSGNHYNKGYQGISMTPQNQPRASLDPAIAVRQLDNGTAQVLQAANSNFKVQLVSPGGGSASDQTRLLSFSALAAAVNPTTSNASIEYTTPDAIYDQDKGRFIFLFSGRQRSATTPAVSGRVILAVSETSDGSTTYWVYRFDPNLPGQYNCSSTSNAGPENLIPALTYPRLSYDRFGIYISYTLECFRSDGTQGLSQYALIAAIPKEAAYTGALTRYALYTSDQMYEALNYMQQPNVTAFDLQQGLKRAAFQPVRPQSVADGTERAFFVTQLLVSDEVLVTRLG